MSNETKQTVMIVDDEEDIVNLMSQTLDLWGYNTIIAQDGEEALNKFRENPIDVVITDLKLPKLSGVKVVEKVKELNEETEVILFTGYPEVKTAVKALKNGASDYLVKPIDLKDLKLKIERAVRKKDLGGGSKALHGFNWALIISMPIWLAAAAWVAYLLRH